MPDDSVYRTVLRQMRRDQKNLRFRFSNTCDFPVNDKLLEKNEKYLISNGADVFKELVKSNHGKNNPFRIFSLEELLKATNNFSADLILSNWTWNVSHAYRGIIEDRHVAVKICTHHTFLNEVVSLSVIKHRNVVKLLGCCLETYYPTAVHELPPNGTLEQNISKLSWTDRLRIATEIADAVAYLHSELHMTHGLLSAAEAVLLDEFHSAKLGAFDFSEIQNKTESSDDGTDNENKFRKLKDVYDFGSILLNILCIQRDERSKLRHCKEKVEILKYVKLNVSEKEMPQIEAYIDLLLRCPSSTRKLRRIRWLDSSSVEESKRVEDGEDKAPSMEEVARELRRIRSM